jgi:hypothetical protein
MRNRHCPPSQGHVAIPFSTNEKYEANILNIWFFYDNS